MITIHALVSEKEGCTVVGKAFEYTTVGKAEEFFGVIRIENISVLPWWQVAFIKR